MASLKEVKNRIDSVKGTLKITSAMKLVASAKYRKAQAAQERLDEYRKELDGLLSLLSVPDLKLISDNALMRADGRGEKVAVVALSSNSSLCGSFNSNVIAVARKTVEDLGGKDRVNLYAIGKKMSEAFSKQGLRSQHDYTALCAKPNYDDAASLANELIEGFESGKYSKAVLVWSHYLSSSNQKPQAETYLPLSQSTLLPTERKSRFSSKEALLKEYIVEPSAEELYSGLLPKVLRLKLYSILLDNAASEHAARMIAMQTASDNAQDLLSDLTLEYNKGRQAKITSEILDLASGDNSDAN